MVNQGKSMALLLFRMTAVHIPRWDQLVSSLDAPLHGTVLEEIKTTQCSIAEISDDKGFNLLHHAVLKGVPGRV